MEFYDLRVFQCRWNLAVMRMLKVSVALLVVCAAVELGCSSDSRCPTIGCTPKISMAFAHSLTVPYSMTVFVAGQTFRADCPLSPAAVSEPAITRCDEGGFEITGLDLGHAENKVVNFTVSIDGSEINATATLNYIINSRDCDVVCYQHSGTLEN